MFRSSRFEPVPVEANVLARDHAPIPPAHSLWMLTVLSTLMGFASISTDLYLPALPTMAHALRSDAGGMELTISGYLIGFSLGQLLWGPLGDRYGRRWPVLIGLALFVAGSAGCALASDLSSLIGWRVVQAVGACAGVVLGRAMVRDLYEGERAARMLSTLMTVMAIAPLLGPILGGQIMIVASWRAIFWTLVGIGAATLWAVYALPETLTERRRNRKPLLQAIADYGLLLRQRQLLGYAGAGGFFYAGMYAYVAGTPAAYITYYHVPAQLYGVLFAGGIVGIMATNLANARLVMRFGALKLLRFGAAVAAIAGVLLAATAWSGWGGLAGLAGMLFLFVTATGFIVANSIAGALAHFPDRAGAVSALVGAVHYGSGIIGSALVGLFADGTPWPLGLIMALSGAGACVCAFATPSYPR